MTIEGPLCQSGGKKMNNGKMINEDGLITFDVNYNKKNYKFIILMDGASGLGKNHEITKGFTSAEWYVKFMLSEMKNSFIKTPTISFEETIETCILKAISKINNYEYINNITLTEYETPSASLAILRTDGMTTDIFSIGDIDIIIGYKDCKILKLYNPNQNNIQKLDNLVISKMVEISHKENCDIIDTLTNPEIQSMLQVNRSKKNTNTKDSYWVCGTTIGSTKYGVYKSLNNNNLDGILLASDGFNYPILDLDEVEIYKSVKKYGTNYISSNIQAAQEIDSKCNSFPRFKKSDDLSVVFCNYN